MKNESINSIKAVEIEINSNCNKACSYCPNLEQKRIEKGNISEELFEKILLELKNIEFKGRISFRFFNEPLLSDKIELHSMRVKSILPHCKILIYTNGTLLSSKKFYDLIKSGVDYLVVTKHEGESSEYLFEKTIEELPLDVSSRYIKFQNFSSLKLTNRGGLIKLPLEQIPHQLPCTIPINMITITNQGSVLPCFEDYHQKNQMGNIAISTLKEIWNSEKYVLFRKKLSLGLRSDYSVCSKCNRKEMMGFF